MEAQCHLRNRKEIYRIAWQACSLMMPSPRGLHLAEAALVPVLEIHLGSLQLVPLVFPLLGSRMTTSPSLTKILFHMVVPPSQVRTVKTLIVRPSSILITTIQPRQKYQRLIAVRVPGFYLPVIHSTATSHSPMNFVWKALLLSCNLLFLSASLTPSDTICIFTPKPPTHVLYHIWRRFLYTTIMYVLM